MVSPEFWSAIFAGSGVLLSGVIFWVTRKAAHEKERADKLENVQQEAEEHTNEKLEEISKDIREMKQDFNARMEQGRTYLLEIQKDVADLKATTAVHEDRWQRPYLSAVPGEKR